MLSDIILTHFQQHDPVIHTFLRTEQQRRFPVPSPQEKYFEHLCSAIIGQQLSGKVADVIERRFRALFPGKVITAEKILEIPEQQLRDVGISWAKVRSLKDLSEKTLSNVIHWEVLQTLSDEDVITELIQVKGIGKWTAEMFLLFTLGRENVFSFGDLGLKKGFMKMYSVAPELTQAELEKRIALWSPYRSYASLALWTILDL